MKLLKKNQLIIYVFVLMLMVAGYFNYMKKDEEPSLETSMEMADIGDATLVNSNDILTDNNTNEIDSETNVTENNTVAETIETNSNNSNDYFTKSKLERDTMYSQMLETYEKVLNSETALETQKQSASQDIQKINETKNSIMICENLIQTKGFENCVIFVNGESISIVIQAEDIKEEDIAQIQNILTREMKAEVENIHIITK